MTSMAWSALHLEGFSTLSSVPCFGNSQRSTIDLALNTNSKRETTTLLGILDDILEEDTANDQEQIIEGSDDQLVELYESLIFANDLQSEISKRLNECTDSKFLEYLNASSESSQDEDERQGFAELINMIDEVKTKMVDAANEQEKAMVSATSNEHIEEESESAASLSENTKPLSNADVLRKASAIDAAIALSDEEKPSDFISDCREVVNLSRGFNDSGQMRVGGG